MKQRIKRIKQLMQDKGIDCVIIVKPENKFYLSGFTGSDGYTIITADKHILFTDFRYVEQAQKQCKGFQVIDTGNDALDTIYNELKSLDVKTIWFEENYVTYDLYQKMDEKFKCMDLFPMARAVERIRIKKDQKEIRAIKKAAEIADKTFLYILDFIKPGVREKDLADEIDYYIKKLGAQSPSFKTIVASGCNSSLPHAEPSEKRLNTGEFITMDFGAKVCGYCSDMTRTVFIGTPDDNQKRLYNTVLEAQKISLDKVACGLKGREVDAIPREFIDQSGYKGCFGHGLGHGVGLEIHEMPALSPTSNVILEENMVVTIEPGIYIEGMYGVRIEDLIVLEQNNIHNLTTTAKQLITL
ncbi:MAG: Xaa-Pro peptidase family protein [Clostridia bacterium]|nr:Xaa-Pro peptidase family protein [Clostridia bacterium]